MGKPVDVSGPLMESIRDNSAYFDRMVELIPARFYFPADNDEREWVGPYKQNPGARAQAKQKHKLAAKEAKKKKLNPRMAKSNEELALERKMKEIDSDESGSDMEDSNAESEEEEEEEEDVVEDEDDIGGEDDGDDDNEGDSDVGAEDDDDDDDDDDANVQYEDSEDGDDDEVATAPNGGKVSKEKGAPAMKLLKPQPKVDQAAPPTAAPIEELRSRLRNRVEELRKKRKADEVSKSVERQKKSKAQRAEERAKREHKPAPVHTPQKGRKDKGSASPTSAPKRKAPEGVVENIAFGNLQYGAGQSLNQSAKKRKKTPEQLLKKAEGLQKKLEELGDTAEGKALKEKSSWGAMLNKAQGVKVKDDPKLLKKTIKRQAKMKAKSTKQWGDRKDAGQKHRDEVAQKRADNIKKHQDGKKSNKDKKKKGGGKDAKNTKRPGFEGKKKDFLNK